MISVEPLAEQHIEGILRTDGGNGWKRDREGWAQKMRAQGAGNCAVRVALSGGRVLGYGSLVWHSDYPAFAASNTPEINDLVTARAHRGQGVASTLIAEFEAMAVGAGRAWIGIGVGLYADYGPAQRLYTSLGYRPDGRGATYGGRPVVSGAPVVVDDELVLWMTKPLPNPRPV